MKALLALIIWSILIAVFSLIPLQSSGPELIPHQDKLIHLICYAILTYLALLSFGHKEGHYIIIKVLLACIIYGIVIEIAQAILNTGRYFDYFDNLIFWLFWLFWRCVHYFGNLNAWELPLRGRADLLLLKLSMMSIDLIEL